MSEAANQTHGQGGCTGLEPPTAPGQGWGPVTGVLVHGAGRTRLPLDGQPFPAHLMMALALSRLFSMAISLVVGSSPSWLPSPQGTQGAPHHTAVGACQALGHWLGMAVPDALVPCTVCSGWSWTWMIPPVVGCTEQGRRVLCP